jgi:hypothetical protein
MKKLRLLLIFITFVFLFLITGAFYWFQIRPSDIRKNCLKYARNKSKYAVQGNNYYRICLTENGMQPESVFVNVGD